MNIYNVPLRDGPQTFAIALSGITYRVRVRYNERIETWVLDLADVEGNSIIRGIPMVTGCNLLEQYHHLNFGGALVAYNPDSDGDAPPQFDNLVGSLLYITGVKL